MSNSRVTQGYRQEDGELLWFKEAEEVSRREQLQGDSRLQTGRWRALVALKIKERREREREGEPM